MIHKMKLNPDPFKKIASGRKTIELRLWDEKRQLLNVGDTIEFENLEDESILTVTVTDLLRFDSFESLYSALSPESFGYSTNEVETASHTDMNAYYSIEEQEKYGVVGIKIELNNVVKANR
jgi:ASC-1-like (ASCH) protein